MNIIDQHTSDKPVSAKPIFSSDTAKVISIRIRKGEFLKEHTTPVPAMLLCVKGEVLYEDEKGLKVTLKPGDYTLIEPKVLHWLESIVDCELTLTK